MAVRTSLPRRPPIVRKSLLEICGTAVKLVFCVATARALLLSSGQFGVALDIIRSKRYQDDLKERLKNAGEIWTFQQVTTTVV